MVSSAWRVSACHCCTRSVGVLPACEGGQREAGARAARHGGAANGPGAGSPAHLVLGHHVGPVQEQHFDDLVAAQPCGVMQRRVAFLQETQPGWGSWSSSRDRDPLPVPGTAPQLPAHPPPHKDKGDSACPSSGCGCQRPGAGMPVYPDMPCCRCWEPLEESAKGGGISVSPQC